MSRTVAYQGGTLTVGKSPKGFYCVIANMDRVVWMPGKSLSDAARQAIRVMKDKK